MTYRPSLSDIPANNTPEGFTPSLADIPQDDSLTNSMLNTAANIAGKFNSGIESVPSYAESFGGGLGNSLANQAENIGNNTSSLMDKIIGKGTSKTIGDFNPDKSSNLSSFDKAMNLNEASKKLINARRALQANEQSNPLTTKLGELAGDAGTFMAAPEAAGLTKANAISRLLLQGGVGAATSSNPKEGALLGAGAELLNPMITTPAKYISSKIFGPNIAAKTQALWEVARGKLAHLGSEDAIKEYEGGLHKKLMADAGKIDSKYPGAFDDSKYVRTLEDEGDQTARQLVHNPNSPQLQGKFEQLGDWANAPHNTLQDMIFHNKALNSVYGGDIKPSVQMPGWLPSFAIKNIKNTIEENLSNIKNIPKNVGKQMMDDIEQANRATKERVKFGLFKDAQDSSDILSRFNKMDYNTQRNLFSDQDIRKIRDFEKATGKIKKEDMPPHLRDLSEYAKIGTRRLPGGIAVGAADLNPQPISFAEDNKQ